MASSYSSGSPQVQQNSGNSDGGGDFKKRKRMESNRESAKRSRMRKQKQLGDLTAQVVHLKKENSKILTSINFTTQHHVNVESENSVLRAQMMELTQRLNSLNEILNYVNNNTLSRHVNVIEDELYHVGYFGDQNGSLLNNSWNFVGVNNNQQYPIMASAEMFDY